MWGVTLAATLVLMGLLHLLARAGPLEARATISLGILLIAAYLGGELARRLRAPRITGFLLTGFALGPAWLGLVRGDEVEALQFIGDVVIALVGFAVGSQLTLESWRRGRNALARLTTATVLFPLAAVSVVVLTVSPWFPLTVHQPFGDALAVALVLGTVAAASSPAVTYALMDELDARGPVARAVLDVSVAKDVVVVFLFSVVLVAGRQVASVGALDVAVAGTTLVRLAGSVAAGAGLGALGARYIRVAPPDRSLVVVGLGLGMAALARVLDLEPLLVALAAGCAAVNLQTGEGGGPADRIVAALRRGSLPVYVVFFALAGAGFHREGGEVLWPWALLLAGLRAVALRYATRWAGRAAVVTPALAQNGWLGLISQAGVALALAAAARRAFPEWGVSLEGMVVALIGVHELAGPICFRRALRLAGEVSEGEHVTEAVHAGAPRDPDVPLGPRRLR